MFARTVDPQYRRILAPVLLLVLLALTSSCSSKGSPTAAAASPLEKLLRSHGISVRLDRTTLSPDAFSMKALKDAWEQHHKQMQGHGDLEFGFSVHCLDWEKIVAFMETLPTLPDAALAPLKGKTIYLNAADIQLSTAAPYAPAQLRTGFTLSQPQAPAAGSPILQLKLVAALDTALALANVARAQQAHMDLDSTIAQYAAQLVHADGAAKAKLLEQQGAAKRKCFNAAHAWRINAMALVEAQPTRADFKESYAQALEAVAQSAVSTDYLSPQF